MGILSRFTDIMKANINELLDRCEDPSKMIDQTLRDLNEDLAKVKKETASVMADEKRAKRELDECDAEIKKYEDLAKKAITAGNDGDAKKFIEKKQMLESNRVGLNEAYTVTHSNAEKMTQMYNKLVSDIEILEGRRNVIKAKVSTAKAQERMNKMTNGMNTSASMKAFERMEAKADKMLDSAMAEAELNSKGTKSFDDLEKKYTSGSASVDEELARLKAELGGNK